MCLLLSCCVPLLYALMCLNVYFGASWCASTIRRWVHASWEPLYLPLGSVQQQHIVSATSSNCRLLLGWHFHTTCSSSYLLIPWLFLLLILLLLPSHPYIWLLHCNALWVKVVGCPSQRICFGVFDVVFCRSSQKLRTSESFEYYSQHESHAAIKHQPVMKSHQREDLSHRMSPIENVQNNCNESMTNVSFLGILNQESTYSWMPSSKVPKYTKTGKSQEF